MIQPTEILQAVLESLRFRKHQVGSVGRLIRGQYFDVDIGARQFALSGYPDFTQASYVERLIDETRLDYDKVEIIDVSQVDSAEESGEYAIAFFGQPDIQGYVSWEPNAQSNRLRIWHDPEALEPGTISDDLTMPLKIVPLLLAEDAALKLIPKCRLRDKNTWDIQTVDLFLKIHGTARAELVEQFDMWRFEAQDQGPTQAARFDAQRRVGPRLRV